VNDLKLFMLLVGCKPAGRNTEQHDVFFSIASNVKDLVPALLDFWPEANGKLHLDALQELTQVGDYDVVIQPKEAGDNEAVSRG
jgi:hypothetical protein